MKAEAWRAPFDVARVACARAIAACATVSVSWDLTSHAPFASTAVGLLMSRQ